jgi:hypothetical protein
MHIYTRFNPIQSCLVDGTRETLKDIGTVITLDDRMKARRFDDEWLRQRLTLFETYTYPTLLSQTDQDFEWVGLVHKDSPDWFVESFEKFPRIRIELVEKDTDTGNPGDITVNLDSDDALAFQFVELAKRFLDHRVLYFVNGLKFNTVTYIRWSSGRNPFNVVPAGDLTVLDRDHGGWPDAKRIERMSPMWLQVIHGDNISNRLRRPMGSKALDYRTQVRPFFKGV